ncbi:MAG UNVERIFIED_CONTAM: 6-carboxytetrahydropterin synthase [Anaerolineae bacterium]|jgi:6-pyruvoyltetrahydropterin/6-carboxytetrahydropterin synthase
MYALAVKRDFVAQHFLIGGDWGAENQWHSHHYVVELQLQGDALDQHGYLVDIVKVDEEMNAMVAFYKDHTLNDLPAFDGLNPSIEHFARILCVSLAQEIAFPNIHTYVVTVWENDIAWASYTLRA